MIKISPSVLACDFSRFGEEVKKVEEAGVLSGLARGIFADRAEEINGENKGGMHGELEVSLSEKCPGKVERLCDLPLSVKDEYVPY